MIYHRQAGSKSYASIKYDNVNDFEWNDRHERMNVGKAVWKNEENGK